MKHLAPLLTFLALTLSRCSPAWAAQLDGAVRFNSGSTGTNTTSGAITISSRTNLHLGVLQATNSVSVGRSGEPGLITLSATNGTFEVSLSVDSSGSFVMTNSGLKIFSLADDTGWAGTGTNFLSDDGTFKSPDLFGVINYDTVPDLLLASITTQLTAIVGGRSALNDGGGGTFYYDGASTASTNLGTIFKPAASGGRWVRIQGGPLNAKWFGAKGDTNANDTAAIQNMFDIMTTGQSAFIPEGVYLVDPLTFNAPDYCALFCGGVLQMRASTTGTAFTLGGGIQRIGYHIVSLKLLNPVGFRNTNLTSQVGVDIKNVNHSPYIEFNHVENFTKNLMFRGDNAGMSYNNFFLGTIWNGLTNIFITGTNDGSCNNNQYFGGSISWGSVVNADTNHIGLVIDHNVAHEVNGNSFYGLGFESSGGVSTNARAAIVHGFENYFYNMRIEGVNGFIFTTNVLAKNYYWMGYEGAPASIPLSESGKDEIHTRNFTYVSGNSGAQPMMTFRQGSSDSFAALAIQGTSLTDTNLLFYGDGAVANKHLYSSGAVNGVDGDYLTRKATIFRFHILPRDEDNVQIMFDAGYTNSAGYLSGDALSNYRIIKTSDQLRFEYASSNAVGSVISTWNPAFFIKPHGNGVDFETPMQIRYNTTNHMAYYDVNTTLSDAPNTIVLDSGEIIHSKPFFMQILTQDRVAVIGADWQLTNAAPTITEINYVDGVTSSIQTQLDSKLTSPLTGDVTTSGSVATLANTAVTPGTYGTSSSVPRVTVDSKGRITSATSGDLDNISNGTDSILLAGGKAYMSAGLDLGVDSAPFGPIDDVVMDGILRMFGVGVGTADSESMSIYANGDYIHIQADATGTGTATPIMLTTIDTSVILTNGAFFPLRNAGTVDLGRSDIAATYWNDIWSQGTLYIYGFGEGTANNEFVTLSHDGAAEAIINSQKTGTGVARPVSVKVGGSSGVQVDANNTAGNTRFLLYDVDNGTLERVSVGAADSGGTGFKVLRIPN